MHNVICKAISRAISKHSSVLCIICLKKGIVNCIKAADYGNVSIKYLKNVLECLIRITAELPIKISYTESQVVSSFRNALKLVNWSDK